MSGSGRMIFDIALPTDGALDLFTTLDRTFGMVHAATYFFQYTQLFKFFLVPTERPVEGFVILDFDYDHTGMEMERGVIMENIMNNIAWDVEYTYSLHTVVWPLEGRDKTRSIREQLPGVQCSGDQQISRAGRRTTGP